MRRRIWACQSFGFLPQSRRRGPTLCSSGDLGQRIFQQPFSWTTLSVDVRGRSSVLKVNYRTSHQIRQAADRLMPKVVRDIDGVEEERFGTVSVFNGPDPLVKKHADAKSEIASVAQWISEALAAGISPFEIGIFVRSRNQIDRARAAVQAAGYDRRRAHAAGGAQGRRGLGQTVRTTSRRCRRRSAASSNTA